ncbi:MAG: hypothetical protein B7X99_13585 [Rhizobiales bacterium 17-65-6]|nr:MAG: hypothetical protein B7X99_13585 [Rhizobiales bacterium 17-65-6]
MPAIIVLRSHYLRRAPAARRMAACGYGPRSIGALLGLSAGRVRDALADRAANGRVWTDRERAALVREMGRAA